MNRLRLGIVGVDHWTGGRVYIHNLVRSLAALPDAERPEVTLLHRRGNDAFEDLNHQVERQVPYRVWFDPAAGGSAMRGLARVWRSSLRLILREAQPEMALVARRMQLDAVYPNFHRSSRMLPGAISWIPDFQHRVLPEYFSERARRSLDRNNRALLQSHGRVIFSSECARQDAIGFYGEPRARMHVVRFTSFPDPSWYESPGPVLKRYGLTEPYLIVCNQFWVHKGHRTLFEAVRLLRDAGQPVRLVCTGETRDNRDPDYFHRLLADLQNWGLDSTIHILGLIPRRDQIMLVRGASAVVQPSHFEGWSTILEDCRALGKKAIVSNLAVHLEQDVAGAWYFQTGNSEDCARAIREHIENWQGLEPAPNPAVQMERCRMFARSFLHVAHDVVDGNQGRAMPVASL